MRVPQALSLVGPIVVMSVACSRGAPPPPPAGTRPPEVATGYATVWSARLYYEIHGAGPALLLMHGGLTSSEDFRQTIPTFARHFRSRLLAAVNGWCWRQPC